MSKPDKRQQTLFNLGPATTSERPVRRLKHPVWTESKAKLIQLYLRLFVLVTKHGAYIDCFAGPQEPDKPDTWAAKLVLESEPRWLQKFFFFEQDIDKVAMLASLRDAQPPRVKSREPKRTIQIDPGDVNENISKILAGSVIRQKEATFCLLDQRTFECHWRTLEQLARYKHAPENKIELFYFMPNAWLDRAFSGLKSEVKPNLWWGRDDWKVVSDARGPARAALFSERFKSELGYASAKAWPIYEREGGGKTMYYMIHATDHPEAPELMARAYNKTVLTEQEFEQLVLELGLRGADGQR